MKPVSEYKLVYRKGTIEVKILKKMYVHVSQLLSVLKAFQTHAISQARGPSEILPVGVHFLENRQFL